MKSRFFKDTQGLEPASFAPDKVSVCIRIDRRAYDLVLDESARTGLTSGEYIERLIWQRAPHRPQAAAFAGTAPPPYKGSPAPRPR